MPATIPGFEQLSFSSWRIWWLAVFSQSGSRGTKGVPDLGCGMQPKDPLLAGTL